MRSLLWSLPRGCRRMRPRCPLPRALADVVLSSTLARRATTRLSASTPATPRTHPPPRHARLA